MSLAAGIEALRKQNYADAERLLTKALAADPKNVTIHDYRARLYMKLDQLDKALDDASSIVKLEPENALGYVRTGRILWKKNDKERALKVFRLGKTKATPSASGKYLEELQKCFNDAAAQVNKTAPAAAAPLAAAEVPAGPSVGDLPPEILVSVFDMLPLKDKLHCVRVCKRWRTAGLEDKRLWRTWDLAAFAKPTGNPAVQLIATRAKSMLQTLLIPNAKHLDDKGMTWLMIQKCTSLSSLAVSDNTRLSAKCVGSVIKLAGSAMRSVKLHELRAADDVLLGAMFRFCPLLESLEISGNCPYTAAAFEVKSKVPLHRLSIHGSGTFNDAALASLLRSCSLELRELAIVKCRNVTRLSLVNLANAVSLESLELTELDFSGPATISIEDALLSLSDRLKSLRTFRAGVCRQMTDRGLENLLSFAGEKMVELDVNYNGRLGDAGARAIATHCRAIETLNISWCPGITSDALLDLVLACGPTLRNLSIKANTGVGDGLLQTICSQCPRLERLDVSKCTSITTLGVSALARSKAGVPWSFICLDGCNRVASEVLQLLAQNLKRTGGAISATAG
ncbi:hypothetical protein DFJ74DRAFT_709075 [Hyaloraphidium curvatum]|nr:hypothetical protein DFJ74DRAFT_709075 [Hyaloraphidium curvatum]